MIWGDNEVQQIGRLQLSITQLLLNSIPSGRAHSKDVGLTAPQ